MYNIVENMIVFMGISCRTVYSRFTVFLFSLSVFCQLIIKYA